MSKEELDADAVRHLLDQSSARIEQSVRLRLQAAREKALVRYDTRSRSPVLAWAGAKHVLDLRHNPYTYWFAAMLLAVSLFGVSYWKQVVEHDVSNVDMAILTDDLPLEMYVD